MLEFSARGIFAQKGGGSYQGGGLTNLDLEYQSSKFISYRLWQKNKANANAKAKLKLISFIQWGFSNH